MDIFKKDRDARRRFALLKTLFILSGISQGVAVVLTIPLFQHLFLGDFDQAIWFLGYIGVTAIFCFILYYIGINIGNHMAIWEVCDSKTRELGGAIIKLPLGWFDFSSKGKVTKAITTDINRITHYPPIVLPEILTVVSSSAVVAIALLFISWKYGLILIVMIPLMVYIWRKTIQVLESIEEENVRYNRIMESTIVEFAQLQPVLRASGVLLDGWQRLNKALNDDKEASVRTLKKKGRYIFRYMLVVNIGMLLILILSAIELTSGVITFYTFVGIFVAMMRFGNPLAGLLGYISEIFSIRCSLERVESIVNAKTLPEPVNPVSINPGADGFRVTFRDVNFSYVQGTKVLNNVSFEAPANSITALVGVSGSGKSTINKLVARFWDVDSGEVLINGINIKSIKSTDLMNLVSMVFQEVYLFNTTIRENVALANPHAGDDEVMEAAKKARLDEVVERLPNGWETNVGEGGSLLSGGEKQRVSIARAFLKNSPILLLDEITSALDGVNEAVVTKSLEELSKNKTVIVIAHRLSSIKHADRIAVLSEGEVVDFDTHEHLLAESERYRSLWQALEEGAHWRL